MTSAVVVAALLAAGPPTWVSLDDAGMAERERTLAAEPLPQRLVDASAGFLGTRYAVSPLGEGEGKDPDPLVRFDAVDCQTMVETVLALSLTPSPEALVPLLSRIRYDGSPAWAHRRHVFEAQWLPQNVAQGLVRDVTRQYGGEATRTVKKKLDARTWKEKSAKALDLPKEARPLGEFSLDLVPADDAVEKLAHAPSGLVVVVVRADRPWLVTRVSHVGFLVQGPDGPLLRHASRSFGKVVDEPLAHYLERNLDYGSWTVEGLALYEVVGAPKGP